MSTAIARPVSSGAGATRGAGDIAGDIQLRPLHGLPQPRGHSLTSGPMLQLASFGFSLWQHEFDLRNRPQGEQIWFQFQVPLGK